MPERKEHANMTRRELCMGLGGAAALIALGGARALPAQAAVRPPGGQDKDRLLALCLRCGRCIEACPWNVLRPAQLEEGLAGVRMPVADYNAGWCDFCGSENKGRPLCELACPTGALSLPEGAEAKTTVLGRAVIDHDLCLAWSTYNGCRYCFKACPAEYSAIELRKGQLPVVVAERCVGCGACQNACVSLEEGSLTPDVSTRAIMVVPLEQAAALEKGNAGGEGS